MEREYIDRETLIKLNNVIPIRLIGKFISTLPSKMTLKKKVMSGVVKEPIQKPDFNLNDFLDYENDDATISRFMETLKTKFTHCNLSAFYDRVETLKIIEEDKTILEQLRTLLGKKFSGQYTGYNNSIRVFPKMHKDTESIEDTMTHELLHMASGGMDSNFWLLGFQKHDRVRNIEIGRGLNEGFTEFLNMVYFSKKERYHYYRLTGLANKIGAIVGPRNMEKFYFSNDLDGLVNSLEKYTTRDKAVELILKMDSIYKIPNNRKFIKYREKLAHEARVDVANIALEKYKQEYNLGKISEIEFKGLIYDMELYINGVEGILRNKKLAKNLFCTSGFSTKAKELEFNVIAEVSQREYVEQINNFYNSFQGDLRFTYESKKDSNGKTTRDYLDEKSEAFKQKFDEQTKQNNVNNKYQTQQEPNQMETPPISEQEKQQELARMFGDKKESNQTSENLTREQELQQMVATTSVQAVAVAANNTKHSSKTN